MIEDLRARAQGRPKGHTFHEFVVGQVFEHHWGRTILAADAMLFSTLTLSFNPLYLNREYAKAHGHPDIVVNPQLIFNMILGMSVEDCSESGGPFLGVFDLTYDRAVYPGTTLTARSTTTEARLSKSSTDNGIVTWRTEGFDEAGERVIAFNRSNFVRRTRLEGGVR